MSTSGYKGVVVDTEEMKDALAVLSKEMPVGTRVQHKSGRLGKVTTDAPPNVPGAFDGRATQVCFADETTGDGLVCVTWDNEFGLRWICWARLGDVAKVEARRTVDGGAR